VKLPERYRSLVNYLANGRWREADQETNRVMLEVAERTERGVLDINDIKAFPCEDLQTIDQLWVKFSGGRFGFSVQKQIWIECGRPMTYNYDWARFGNRVGWRKEGYWVDYDDLIFDLNAPAGEFPYFQFWGLTKAHYVPSFCLVASERGWCLFSRAETCEL
jgi:hypothetical protein